METFLIRLLQFVLAISLLVLLHEGGHMFFAKLFGVRVEKFFVFFDVNIGKWSGKLFSWKPKKDDTEYGMGWLPLGGYCKISGMIDESLDREQMKKDPQPWEFRTKPAWQRLLIMIGGVLVNFVLALFIYSMIMFTWGDSYFKVSDMTMGMRFNADAKALGFKDHDVMLGTDQGAFREFANVNGDFFRQIAQAKRVDVLRNGKKQSIKLPGDMDMLSMIKTRPYFVEPFIPAQVDSVMSSSPAAKAGMKAGDVIKSINGKAVETWSDMNYQTGVLDDVMAVKNTHKDSLAARSVVLTVQHKGATKLDTMRMVMTPDLKLGVYQSSLASFYKPVQVQYSFGSIGSLFPPYWDWYMFWSMTAFLSIILAFMNILPIPALDGGHVVFLLYEMITRRKPSEKFMVWAEYAGITILIILMVFANLNDILRWLHVM